jgi:hypothetical protein
MLAHGNVPVNRRGGQTGTQVLPLPGKRVDRTRPPFNTIEANKVTDFCSGRRNAGTADPLPPASWEPMARASSVFIQTSTNGPPWRITFFLDQPRRRQIPPRGRPGIPVRSAPTCRVAEVPWPADHISGFTGLPRTRLLDRITRWICPAHDSIDDLGPNVSKCQ